MWCVSFARLSSIADETHAQRSFSSTTLTPVSFSKPSSLAEATFCESVEAAHSSHSTNARIAQLLGITRPSVRMDSQAKYCSISRGDGDIYLRLPAKAGYVEKIWVHFSTSSAPPHAASTKMIAQDHASGALLVAEAGGKVTDMNGRDLDFSKGRTLKENKGVIAASKELHGEVLAAVQKAVAEERK